MGEIRKLLVAVAEPDSGVTPAIDRARMLARAHQAEVRLFNAVYNQYIAGIRFLDSPDLAKSRELMAEARKEALQGLARGFAADGTRVSVNAAWGFPTNETIIREALQWEADVVMADTRVHKHVRWALTNTDWQLIRTCPLPLLLTHDTPQSRYGVVLAAVDPIHGYDRPAALDHVIIERAQEMAAPFSGQVHVLHACTPLLSVVAGEAVHEVLPSEFSSGKVEQLHREALEELVARHDIPSDRVCMRSGQPHELLPAFVTEISANLVVMGAVARSRIERLLIGSTAERALDEFACDVLIVKPEGFESPATG